MIFGCKNLVIIPGTSFFNYLWDPLRSDQSFYLSANSTKLKNAQADLGKDWLDRKKEIKR